MDLHRPICDGSSQTNLRWDVHRPQSLYLCHRPICFNVYVTSYPAFATSLIVIQIMSTMAGLVKLLSITSHSVRVNCCCLIRVVGIIMVVIKNYWVRAGAVKTKVLTRFNTGYYRPLINLFTYAVKSRIFKILSQINTFI